MEAESTEAGTTLGSTMGQNGNRDPDSGDRTMMDPRMSWDPGGIICFSFYHCCCRQVPRSVPCLVPCLVPHSIPCSVSYLVMYLIPCLVPYWIPCLVPYLLACLIPCLVPCSVPCQCLRPQCSCSGSSPHHSAQGTHFLPPHSSQSWTFRPESVAALGRPPWNMPRSLPRPQVKFLPCPVTHNRAWS